MQKRSTRGVRLERERTRRRATEERKARESVESRETFGTTIPDHRPRGAVAEGDDSRKAYAGVQPEAAGSGRRAGRPLQCGWCASPLVLKRTGRLPKWCSATCRQRAWELERAAASGRAAVQVVDRQVLVTPGNNAEWIDLLNTLGAQLRQGFVHGDAVGRALRDALDAAEDQERRHELLLLVTSSWGNAGRLRRVR